MSSSVNYLTFPDIENKSKKKSKLLNFCKYFFIIFGIISFIFFITTIILYSLNVNHQNKLSYKFSNSSNDIVLTYSSLFHYRNNFIQFINNSSNKELILYPETKKYYTNNLLKKYIYKIELLNLTYNTVYKYKINLGKHKTNFFEFILKKNNTKKILFIGDLGLINSPNINKFNGDYNFIFHLGDIAYNLDSYFGIIGDIFLSKMVNLIGKIPYMTIPGNHENFNNFSEYINRFYMPNYETNKNLFYTIDNPPFKMININTEAFYFKTQKNVIPNLMNFIEKELNYTNRIKYPYLIVTGHRPMYCSNKDKDDCINWKRDILRDKLENLINKYNTTLYISAHEHSYERLCPIYNGSCLNTSFNNKNNSSNNKIYSLNNLKYPIHITTGAAGCIEGSDKFVKKKPYWSILRNSKSGYGVLTVNNNYLNWKEYIYNNDSLIDEFIIYNN